MELSRRTTLSGLSLGLVAACAGPRGVGSSIAALEASDEAQVTFDVFDPKFSDIVDVDAPARWLSKGHWWAEGPAWDSERQSLYFTDVPRNRAYAWKRETGISTFLDPSGIAPEQAQRKGDLGANGLLIGNSGELLICNHGKRCVEALDFDTGQRRTLAGSIAGKRFNSPNDLIQASDGTIYFTDPPYGLDGLNNSPLKELDRNGVYRLRPDGEVTLIVDDMTFPNGVALSPDERFLYVAQSDTAAPLIRRIATPSPSSSAIDRGEVWFDCQPFMHEAGGLPDGLALAQDGYVFLAGPAGVLVIDQEARCLGRINTGRASANCAFGEDGRTVFITAKDSLVAVRTKAVGLGRF